MVTGISPSMEIKIMPAMQKKVLVIGGGIVGISCGLYAQRSGHKVQILDPKGFAGGASSGNAGVIALSECVPMGTPELMSQISTLLLGRSSPLTIQWRYAPFMLSWFYHFFRSCSPDKVETSVSALSGLLGRAHEAHQDLARHANCNLMLRENGWMRVFESDDSFGQIQNSIQRMREHGIKSEYLNAKELVELEPGLNPIFKHAVYHPAVAHVEDPEKYTKHLGHQFISLGGELIRAEATGFKLKDGVITEVITATGSYTADAVVIAAGAWSKELTKKLGIKTKLEAERGYHLIIEDDKEKRISMPILWEDKSLVMSPSSIGTKITNGVEFAGLKKNADYKKSVNNISHIRKALKTPLKEVKSEWLGFRPSTPDSIPIISKEKSIRNVFLCFGHGHLGLTLGPISGKIISNLIDNMKTNLNMDYFSIERFK